MPPQIVLIRHAQALHNVDKDYSIHDPPLSDLGVEQCAALRASLKERFSSIITHSSSVAVVVSPMVRTLQTAFSALDWLHDQGVVFEADADWQENSAKPCDIGSPISSISPSFPPLDLSRLDPIWPDKTSTSTSAASRYGYSRAAVLARGVRALDALRARKEDIIFVVSHSGFLRSAVCGFWFFNADYRIFRFDDGDGAVDGAGAGAGAGAKSVLRQDESTLAGGLGLSWTHREELGFDLPGEDEIPVEDKAV